MFEATGFQALPGHILERIALYVSNRESTFAMTIYDPSYCDDEPVKAYLPLMAVNRTLRVIAASLFYRFASMEIGMSKRFHSRRYVMPSILSLEDVAKIGAQDYVKQIRLEVDAYVLEDGLYKDTKYIEDEIIPLIEKFSKFTSANTFYLTHNADSDFMYESKRRWRHVGEHPEDPKSKVLEDVDISGALDKIKRAVVEAVPRARRVVFLGENQNMYNPTEHDKKLNRNVLDFMESLVSSLALGHVSLIKTKVSKGLLASLSSSQMALRSITLSHNKGSQQHIEIVRRNWSRLEKLHLDHLTTHAVVRMTWGDGGSGTLVYPRLKHLCINVCSGSRSSIQRQPTTNPFPALTTLICHGQFPFSTPIILTEGAKHIRRLDLDLDADLMEEYGNTLFAERSFEALENVTLGWCVRGSPRVPQSQILFTKALSIGAKTQVAHLHNLKVDWLDSASLKGLHALATLHSLDMELTSITPVQALMIFNACPQLQRAYISLQDETERRYNEIRMPDETELTEFQETHKGCKSRLQSLGIYSTGFSRSRRAAEYIVMISNVLPCLKRVCVSSFIRVIPNKYIPDNAFASKLYDAINSALKRKAYKNNTKIHSIDFTIDNCW
ncbi:hypothetical protein GGI11_000921 [Coemansia sp. RSA 2049]|nr:hypothetical protein GGI11_000921 [Coemansia sp. RSA 2049]